MKCFLACFRFKKNKPCPKSTPVYSSSAPGSPKAESSDKPVQQNLATNPAKLDESIIVVPQSPAKQEELLSLGIPKKVSFVSNVGIHSPSSDSVEKAADISTATKQVGDGKIVVNEDPIAVQSILPPASETDGSSMSSLGSFLPNHRYPDCTESVNQDELDCEVEMDLDDYDEEDSLNENQVWTPVSLSSMESRTKSSTSCLAMRNLGGMLDNHGAFQVEEMKSGEDSGQLKEKSISLLNLDEREHDASLSGSQKTLTNNVNARAKESTPSETTQTTNSVRNFSDRPILGALTIEELRQISAFESPRKSPSSSVADRPIIGSVGSHWSEETPSVQSASVSSFKGIPNTSSKYREDKRVKWHSTPFETRLEQALKRGASGVPF